MKVLPMTKVSRYLCTDFLKFPHLARVSNVPLDINEIRQACVKRVSREVVEKIIAGRKEKKRKPLESIVEFLRASPPKVTSDVTMTPQPTTHVTKTRSKSTSSMHPSPITSPTRKMLHSPRLYIPQANVNEVAEPRPAHSSKHLLSRKRSLENVNTHQNGLDGPATKRFVSNSPLGKKGCECKHCGKVLHNQASLSHHMQTVHAVSYQPSQGSGPPKQKTYPAYCDVKPGMGPGVTKMAPYAEHTVTSYNTPGLKSPPQPPTALPISQPLSNPPPKQQQQQSEPTLGAGVNRKLSAPTVKNHSAVNGQNKSRGRSSPTRQPQFIDPPEEFVFSSTKVMRSARKSIENEVKRRLPRKPWMEVKCPAELRELVYRTRKPRKNKEKTPAEVPTKSDHIVNDGKKASPVKNNEVAEAVAPLFAVNDEKPPVISQGDVPPENIEPGENIDMPADKESVTPVGEVAAGAAQVAADSGTPGKTGGVGGTRVDEPIVIDD
ncbi:metastasis-associated MTA3-like [Paramuricea clavata]|uniref:Metastasis-associated MTA3-like n=1 Tax=Paramuricea clavata TaxID=317549 RepID=A0A6S7GBM4_PARCT|nr:metastasis-associated MTA3-like [Paramuricea clavata]